MCVCACVYVYVCIYVCVYVYAYVCVYVCMSVYVCIYVCISFLLIEMQYIVSAFFSYTHILLKIYTWVTKYMGGGLQVNLTKTACLTDSTPVPPSTSSHNSTHVHTTHKNKAVRHLLDLKRGEQGSRNHF